MPLAADAPAVPDRLLFRLPSPPGGRVRVCVALPTGGGPVRLVCHDAGGQTVVLRLTLRPEAGVLILNDRPLAAAWGTPLQVPLPAAWLRPGAVLALLRRGDRLRLCLDGRRILRLPAGASGMGRFAVGRMAWISLDNPPAGIWINGAAAAPARFAPRLTVGAGGWVTVAGLSPLLAGAGAQLRLRPVLAVGADVAMQRLAGRFHAGTAPEDGLGFTARLPGAVWAGGVAALELTLVSRGQPLVQARLTRAECLADLRALPADASADLMLAALEMALRGGFWPDLPQVLQARLRDLAERQGLDRLLPAATGGAAPAAPALPPPRPLDLWRDAYAAARAADPARDPLAVLAAVLQGAPPAPDLLLTLAEDFAQVGRITALADLAQRQAVVLPRPEPGDSWRNSALLPFLLLGGDLDAARQALEHLAQAGGGWLVSPVLGWALQPLLAEDGRLPAAERAALLRGWMAAVEAQARDPWGRAACDALQAAALDLLRRIATLPPALATEAEGFLRRSFGLSPRFRAAVLAAGLPLPPLLRAAVEDLGRLQQLVLVGAGAPEAEQRAAAAALDRLEHAGVHGAAVWRRECPALAAQAHDDDTLLRRYAAPGAADIPAAGLARLRAVIAARIDPALPASAAPRRAGCAAALRLLAGAGGPEDPAAVLAGGGPPLALATLAGLVRRGRWAEAAALAARLPESPGAADPALLARLRTRLDQVLDTPPQGGADPTADLAPMLAQALAGWPAAAAVEGGPLAAELWQRTDPLFDTLVMIRTCRPHLDGRATALRAGWLAALADLGIPHVIAVGGATETRLRGDLLELAVGDDAGALPAKTLAMLAWAAATPFAHVWLVEDDAVLDPEAVFGSWSWRLIDYYGRWQQLRPGFRLPPQPDGGIDLSPEGHGHADAGLGYALGRRALATLQRAAQSAAGARLILGSAHADKLVGDLLALEGIGPMAPDHTGALLRPARPGGLPVLAQLQGFLPGAASGAHTGHPGPAAPGHSLRPPRLWPASLPARVGPAGRALVLAAGEDRLAQAQAAPVAVISVLRNEMFILPHFLAHYRRLGVTAFLIADNGSDDGSAEYLAAQPDVVLFSAAAPFRAAMQGTEWKIALMAQLRPGGWSLVADPDELLVGCGLTGPGHPRGWQGGDSLPAFLARPEWAGCDAFRLRMLDMYPAGPLAAATFASGDPFAEAGLADRQPFLAPWLGRGPFSDRRALTSGLRHRLMPGSRPDLFIAEKVALLRYRPWMRLSVSLHYAAEVRLAPQELIFAHFKYNAEFHAKARREIRRGQYYNNAAEYRRYVAILSEGRDVIATPGLSVPWRAAVAELL